MCTYLNGTGLIFVVFCIGFEVINIDGGQAGDEQFQLLLSEDGDQSLGDDLIEALQEGSQLFTDCTWETNLFQLPDWLLNLPLSSQAMTFIEVYAHLSSSSGRPDAHIPSYSLLWQGCWHHWPSDPSLHTHQTLGPENIWEVIIIPGSTYQNYINTKITQ